MTFPHRRRSWLGRASKVMENAEASSPVLSRTGPALAFGTLGMIVEIIYAPIVLALTVVIGIITYLILDTPRSHVRAQQRPRFVSVRILYLNGMILTGFWLAVMFTFSAADPSLANSVDQRLPGRISAATTADLHTLVSMKSPGSARQSLDAAVADANWFDIFLHGLAGAVSLNFLLYGVVIARRRMRTRHAVTRPSRESLRYDALVGLFVDEDSAAAR